MKYRLLAVLLAPLWLANCATIIEGSDQQVTVLTVPSGANCQLSRSGGVIGIVNPTPGSIEIDKSKYAVAVKCSKANHQDGVGVLRSSFEGMTFGNLIFGGFIGVAIDAGSGAMNEYPSAITVSLPPNQFPNTAARDEFYNRRIDEVRSNAAATKKQIAGQCTVESGDDVGCKIAQGKVDEETARQINQLEAERVNAPVARQ